VDLVHLDLKDQLEGEGHQVNQGQRVSKGIKGPPALLVCLVNLVVLESLEGPDRQVLLDQ